MRITGRTGAATEPGDIPTEQETTSSARARAGAGASLAAYLADGSAPADLTDAILWQPIRHGVRLDDGVGPSYEERPLWQYLSRTGRVPHTNLRPRPEDVLRRDVAAVARMNALRRAAAAHLWEIGARREAVGLRLLAAHCARAAKRPLHLRQDVTGPTPEVVAAFRWLSAARVSASRTRVVYTPLWSLLQLLGPAWRGPAFAAIAGWQVSCFASPQTPTATALLMLGAALTAGGAFAEVHAWLGADSHVRTGAGVPPPWWLGLLAATGPLGALCHLGATHLTLAAARRTLRRAEEDALAVPFA